ncbi:unnamed protein product [Dracunculus medinensis]|uniref:EF-hand domain-containing protein n=1 Tax=Dracunculus medinensis TaxID=318479 RepID=A0A0N4U451_DRAME|nr:unnamed protein product [Dracunculus medinensis]
MLSTLVKDDFSVDQLTPYCRPESISKICKLTKFSSKEVKFIYRAFKQGYPCGTITLEQFQQIYAQFFPFGNSRKYAEYVFRTFDRDDNGKINFEVSLKDKEFITGLSIISRGTVVAKMEWIFDLYDINRRGLISPDGLFRVIHSIYQLLGRNIIPPVDRHIIETHVFDVFKRMDKNNDGIVTRQEFLSTLLKDEALCQSFKYFDTRF